VKNTKGLWKTLEKRSLTAKDFEYLALQSELEETKEKFRHPNFKFGSALTFGYLTLSSTTNKIAQTISGISDLTINVYAACSQDEQDESDEETESEIIADPTENCNICSH
jgi:hypothetical protein